MNAKRYTGEVLLRTRPKTYYKVIHLLADATPVDTISRICKVSEHTVNAISVRRAEDVAEIKKQIISNLSDVATIGSERLVQQIGKAGIRDVTIATGVSVDKMLALSGQTPSVQVAVILPDAQQREELRALDQRLDAIARRLTLATHKALEIPPPESP